MANGFGLEKNKKILDKLIGKWFMLYDVNGARSYAGKVKGEFEGDYVLNPFSGGEWDNNGDYKAKIIHQDFFVPIASIGPKEPTTRKSLENHCKHSNEKNGNGDNGDGANKKPQRKKTSKRSKN